jgi:hypothetical protein
MIRRLFRALGLVAVGSLAFAQDAKPVPADAIPSSFRAFVAADDRFEKGSPRNRADKMHCLVVDNALNPTVAVFSRLPPMLATGAQPVANPEVSKLATKLNELVTDKELKAQRLGAFVMFLTLGKEYPEDDKRDEAAKQAKDLSAQLKSLGVPFALAPGKSESTAAWAIGEKDTLTVVFYREMKTLQKWTFTAEKPLGDDDVKAIAAAVEKELRAKK